MWDALVDLIRGYAARYRAEAQHIESKKPFLEGRYAFLTAYGTVFGAFLALVAAVAFWCQFWAIKDDTIAANRGWLVMTHPSLVRRQISPDRMTLATKMTLSNIGKSPAFDVSTHIEGFFGHLIIRRKGDAWNLNMAEQHFDANTACEKARSGIDHGTVWQGQLPIYVSSEAVEPPIEFYRRPYTYAVRGCIIYTVFGETHYTRFCEFLAPQPPAPFEKWEWSFCVGPGQNDAT